MLTKLRDTPGASALLPFVMQFYGKQSHYLWTDDNGKVHDVLQGEGCEQGDPLSPALFSLGLHKALKEAQDKLPEGDFLVAYLDDVYLCTTRENALQAFRTTTQHVRDHAGIRVHLGKTQCWPKAGGEALEGIPTLDVQGEGPVWKGDLEPARNGIVVLGAPLGSELCVRARGEKRLEEEQKLLDTLPHLPDLQCAWLLLYFSAVPRANHLLRQLPPLVARPYAEAHDQALAQCLSDLLRTPITPGTYAARVASLALRDGGARLQQQRPLHSPCAGEGGMLPGVMHEFERGCCGALEGGADWSPAKAAAMLAGSAAGSEYEAGHGDEDIGSAPGPTLSCEVRTLTPIP